MRWLSVFSLALLVACQSPKVKPEDPAEGESEEEEAEKSEPKKKVYVVGEVKYLRDGFVLVERTGRVWPKKEVDLKSYSENGEETAELGWSPERAGRYFAADILGGEPKEGDTVVSFPQSDEDNGLTPIAGAMDPVNSEVFWPSQGDRLPGGGGEEGRMPTSADLPPLGLPPGVERPELPDGFGSVQEGEGL